MLNLSRKPNESVDLYLGDELLGTVTVTKVSGKKVQLGFEGQPRLVIQRREVTEAIEREGTSNVELPTSNVVAEASVA